MTRARRSLLLPAMLAVLIAVFFAVLRFERWTAARVRPPPAPVQEAVSEPAAAPAPVAAEPAKPGPAPSTLHRCVGSGAPVYTTEACPPGTRLDRDIAVAAMRSESPELRRARERCEAGRLRERLELAKLGTRRSSGDLRLWGDYALRECAAYTAMVR